MLFLYRDKPVEASQKLKFRENAPLQFFSVFGQIADFFAAREIVLVAIAMLFNKITVLVPEKNCGYVALALWALSFERKWFFELCCHKFSYCLKISDKNFFE